jgi:transposase-like protein
MARRCSICDHQDRQDIDKQLVSGESIAGIARHFAVSEDALRRHSINHIPQALAQAKKASDAARAGDLLQQVINLRERAVSILSRAEESGDLRTALAGIREAKGCIELLAKIDGQLNEKPQLNITISPQWIELRTLIISALEPYPLARQAVLDALP